MKLSSKNFCNLDNNLFKLSIIGKGWQEIVFKLRKQKIEVNFYKKFLGQYI